MKKPFDLWFWIMVWVGLVWWLTFFLLAEFRARQDGIPMLAESYFQLCVILAGLAVSTYKLGHHFLDGGLRR